MSSQGQLVRASPPPFEFTAEQRRIILDSFLNGATESEAAVLLELARVRRLNPITRQIHFVKRYDSERNSNLWAAQVGIDGFRSIAERTGLYDGQDEPEFSYAADGKVLVSCRVRVYRKDWSRPAVGVAHLTEYAQRKRDGQFTRMWMEKPHVMLAKCAEALAFRKAFPEDTSGLYVPEEEPGESLSEAPEAPRTGKRVASLKQQLAARLVREAPTVTVEAPRPESAAPAFKRRPEMTIPDAQEPPPHSDADAPAPAFEPGVDVEDDRPHLPPPAEAPVTMSFGSGKGKPLRELQRKDLAWYERCLTENVADPAKAKFREDNQKKLAAITAELRRRPGVA